MHPLIHPLAISIMLVTGLSRTLGRLILSDAESSRAIALFPEIADLTISIVPLIACGPRSEAVGYLVSRSFVFALGRQPAIIKGFPVFINWPTL